MAIDMINRVAWRTDIKGVAKNVAMALANFADEHGSCYPSVRTLAQWSGWSDRAVQQAISHLCAAGLMRAHRRSDSSNIYQFVMPAWPLVERVKGDKERTLFDEFQLDLPGAAPAPPPCSSRTPPVQEPRVGGESPAPITVNEPSVEPSDISAPLGDAEIADLFVERWNAMADRVERVAAVNRLGDKRKTSLLARIKEYAPQRAREDVAALIDRIIATIEGSRFLRGEEKSFTASAEWALTPKYFPKLEETGYVQDAAPGARRSNDPRDRSHVAAGREARAILHAGVGATRRSAREIAGGRPRRAPVAN